MVLVNVVDKQSISSMILLGFKYGMEIGITVIKSL